MTRRSDGRARGYAPLAWSEEDAALVRRIERLAQSAGPGHVAVFDLDGCLFDTRPRQVQILWELASAEGMAPLYRVHAEHFTDWELVHTLRAAGIDEAWISAHIKRVRDFWFPRFFASDYLVHDLVMPGATRLVQAVFDAGLHVVYLTGRDESMRPGTVLALRRFGFPLDERTALLMKPEAKMDDLAFKDGAISGISALGSVAIYLDNEPANVNMYRRHHPESLVVFVETDHSPRADRPDSVIPWLRCLLAEPV